MTPDVFGNDVLMGFLAALGAAFCFGYAVGHHFAGRASPRPRAEEIHGAPSRPPARPPVAAHHAFRLLRRRRS